MVGLLDAADDDHHSDGDAGDAAAQVLNDTATDLLFFFLITDLILFSSLSKIWLLPVMVWLTTLRLVSVSAEMSF